jgi:hypothetical protein
LPKKGAVLVKKLFLDRLSFWYISHNPVPFMTQKNFASSLASERREATRRPAMDPEVAAELQGLGPAVHLAHTRHEKLLRAKVGQKSLVLQFNVNFSNISSRHE